MRSRLLSFLALISFGVLSIALPVEADGPPSGILLATTTSVRDSGLLDTLVPVFEQRSGFQVRVVAVGTGAALRMGREGNADVLITHARQGEEELVQSGAALGTVPFMENYFVIVGPPEDPLKVATAATPADALHAIATGEGLWVSRGDDSGTHRREQSLLREAGLPEDGGWQGFVRTGAGMGLTLQVAGERRAYTLSDIGTFLAFASRTELVALSKPAPSLRNVYSVLRISPERFRGRVNAEGAQRFAEFLLEPETRERIAGFGLAQHGRALFSPLEPDSE